MTTDRAGRPSRSAPTSGSISAADAIASLSPPRARFCAVTSRFSRLSRSASISSVSTTSASRTGSMPLSTCAMSGSSKQRSTWMIASTSRICARNWLPRPSPLLAPRTRPAISTNSSEVGTIFADLPIAASVVEARIRHRHAADIRLDGAERVVRRLRRRGRGQRVEQRGLAHVRQPDDAAVETHPTYLSDINPLVDFTDSRWGYSSRPSDGAGSVLPTLRPQPVYHRTVAQGGTGRRWPRRGDWRDLSPSPIICQGWYRRKVMGIAALNPSTHVPSRVAWTVGSVAGLP